MGKVKEQLADVISTQLGVEYVTMWRGPRDAAEIEKTLAGSPTLVPCAIGPNLNDGQGVYGIKQRKGFLTIKEMHEWIAQQKPEEKKFPCPYCPDDENRFEGNSAKALAGHIMAKHKGGNVVSTPDFEGVKTDKLADEVKKKLKGPRAANRK